MRMAASFGALIVLMLALSACSTDEVLRIRSLKTPTDPVVQSSSDGSFVGLKKLTATASNTNVIFVHGIGWTQEKSSTQFGDDLVSAIARAFQGAKVRANTYECATSTLDGRIERRAPQDGLIIAKRLNETQSMQSDDPGFLIKPTGIGCLDRFVIDIGHGKTVTVYRFLWDDAMWNGVEWFHMAYDDSIALLKGRKASHPGYDDPDALRATLNAQLKKSVITYGLTDAAMYMSPIGQSLRDGVQAAICVALTNSFDSFVAAQKARTPEDLCVTQPPSKSPLLIASHSLGSRIVFDTLTTDLTDLLAERLSAGVANDALEIHMLANQIPLVGVGRLGHPRTGHRIAGKSVAFVAYSEINDLLTYELVPYFEQLYYVRCYGERTPKSRCGSGSGEQEFVKRAGPLSTDVRASIADDLGFDVLDVRLQFAPNKVFLYPGFKDPGIAHSGHLQSESVLTLLFCGAEHGKARMSWAECARQ